MKRILTILAILILPLSVWAMTPVTDSDLSNVTGQAGVNINANVSMDIHIGTMAWGDSDGITSVFNPWSVAPGGSGGYIGISNFNLTNLTIEARMESSDTYNGYNTMMLKPITIDVATVNMWSLFSTTPSWGGGPLLTESLPAGTTFVRIGLGALEIAVGAMTFDVNLYHRVADVATNDIDLGTASVQNLGDVELGTFSIYINPWSYVDIYSPAKGATGDVSGVRFAVNVTLDRLDLSYLGWSDHDGITLGVGGPSGQGVNKFTGTNWMATNSAGYIGLTTLEMGIISINGTVGIDVNTTDQGIYAQLPAIISFLDGNSLLGVPTGFYKSEATVKGVLGALGFNQYTGLTTGVPNGTPLNAIVASLNGHSAGTVSVNPVSVVHISFPTEFLIDVRGPVTAAVQLSNSPTFAAGVGTTTLGDIYLQNFGFDIHSGSWVDIWAH